MEEQPEKTRRCLIIKEPIKDIISRFNRMDSKNEDGKIDLRNEREKMNLKLRLSRDELDSYIRHSKKIIDSKRQLELENTDLKSQLRIAENKISRIERSEVTLRTEFAQLLKLIQDSPYQKEDDRIRCKKITDTLDKMLNDPIINKNFNSAMSDLDRVNQDIADRRKILDDLNREIAVASTKSKLNLYHTQKDSADANKVPTDSSLPLVSVFRKHIPLYLSKLCKSVEELESRTRCRAKDPQSSLPTLAMFEKIATRLTKNNISEILSEYTNYIDLFFERISSHISYLDMKAFELHNTNEGLNDEISQLKYALSHRYELVELRNNNQANLSNSYQAIIDKLQQEIDELKNQLVYTQNELYASAEQNHILIGLMADTKLGPEESDQLNEPINHQPYSDSDI